MTATVNIAAANWIVRTTIACYMVRLLLLIGVLPLISTLIKSGIVGWML